MQDIPQETHHETTRLTQSAQVVLWEIDLTRSVVNVIFSVMSRTKKVSRLLAGAAVSGIPHSGDGI